MRRRKVLLWNTHEDYLRSLFQCPHDFYLVSPSAGNAGPLPENVHEISEKEVKNIDLDIVLFQNPRHFTKDRHEILSERQNLLPKIYLEHDLPMDVMDMHHWVDDPQTHLVHVTAFDNLMWNCGRTPTRVIEHGVLLPRGVQYVGDLPKGLVVLDHLGMGGMRLGLDIYQRVRKEIPLDLIGINARSTEGGLADVPAESLAAFASHYRFLFVPTRYTSLSPAVCQMMMMGMPVVGLATSELSTVVRYGVSGYVHTDIQKLIQGMKKLIQSPQEAHRLGRGAYRYAHERFNIKRFVKEWNELFELVCERSAPKNDMACTIKQA